IFFFFNTPAHSEIYTLSLHDALPIYNNGSGTFSDVTDKAGVAGLESGAFHSGATFFDYDGDGYLDLYVGSYVALDPDGPRYCNRSEEHTSELQSLRHLVCRLLLEKKK